MKKEGGVRYQSMGLLFFYIPANFFCFLKDPGPLNNKKRLTAAKQLSMLLDWIKVLPLQKNTIASGSLPGFFSIAV